MGGAMCIYLGSAQGCADTPYLTVSATDITRSPATSGTQTVMAVFTPYHWTGSEWEAGNQTVRTAVIPSGEQTVRMPIPTISVVEGYTMVTAGIGWFDAQLRTLGVARVNWTDAGDYLCVAEPLDCTTGPGWIWFGYRY
jgi:hypothetical protein